MKTSILTIAPLGILFLAACEPVPVTDGEVPQGPQLPPRVAESIPPGIDLNTVTTRADGCYVYRFAGDQFTVVNEDGGAICDPSKAIAVEEPETLPV